MGQQDFQNVRIGIDVTPLAETQDADSRIGTGAYGVVRKAQYTDHSGNAHRVAVKYANDLKEQRAHLSLRNELKVFDRLGPHPHIVRCFGGKLGDGDLQVDAVSDKLAGSDFYLVLELMDMNLNDLLLSREFTQQCTYRMLLNICMQITDGLDFLHSQNIIHYDLKPANVLLDEALNVKLADFGLSKVKLQSSITASFKGQYGYMAPEVMLSLHIPGLKASDKVDIFSLGVIIWECLMKGEGTALDCLPSLSLDSSTGSSTSHDLCYVGSTRYMLGRDWPESLVKLLEDCVNIQPDQRPSCRDVRDRLKLIIEDPWAKKRARDGVQEEIQSHRKQEHIVMDSAMDMHSPLCLQMAVDL